MTYDLNWCDCCKKSPCDCKSHSNSALIDGLGGESETLTGKRTIAVEINSGKKLCGSCEFSHYLYVNQPPRRRCNLFGVGKKFGERCRECLDAEIKGYRRP
jgi:hypothetical protein